MTAAVWSDGSQATRGRFTSYTGWVFGRQKTRTAEAEAASLPADPTGRKGRPTRTRKEAEAARRRPLVIDDRKEAKRRERERQLKARADEQKGLIQGDERLMPERDRGPVKRFVRNYVDSRRSVGEYTMILVFIPVLLTFVPDLRVQQASVYLLWALMGATIVDTYGMAKKLRRILKEKFGPEVFEEKPLRYAVMRTLQVRRLRLPKPVVKHGQPLE